MTLTPTVSSSAVLSPGVLERLTALRQTLAPTLTDAELELFGLVAQRKGLDPFSGQIRAIKRNTQRGPVVTYQTGIDGYRSIAERTGQYLGSEDAEFGEDCDCGKPPAGHPKWARVVARRWHDESKTVMTQPGRADWHEFVPSEAFMWLEKPHVMIAKCAEAQALRKAFPWVLGDIYIPEEVARDEPAAPPAPSGRELVAARAAELRGPEEATVGEDGPEIVEVAPITEMTTPDFLRAIVTYGVDKEQLRTAGGELFPGRQLSELSDEERARLFAVLTDNL